MVHPLSVNPGTCCQDSATRAWHIWTEHWEIDGQYAELLGNFTDFGENSDENTNLNLLTQKLAQIHVESASERGKKRSNCIKTRSNT